MSALGGNSMFARENKIAAWNIGIAMTALFIGGFFGPLQKLEHVGINAYTSLQKIGIASYYQGLTTHAVMNALVWTTFFIVGFFTFAITHSLKRELRFPWVNWLALVLMTLGLISAAVPILMNLATVLYTFYPPMQANIFFYIGLT
ncbi:MAG TPA: cytochrome C oxidase subunit I, partial [Anaerolineae bacterium]|nr:cytochrome C oxidase subunit I [Anaerolineae bacterium]